MVASVIHISDEFELGGDNEEANSADVLFTSSVKTSGGGDVIVPGGGDDSGSGVDYEKSEKEWPLRLNPGKLLNTDKKSLTAALIQNMNE